MERGWMLERGRCGSQRHGKESGRQPHREIPSPGRTCARLHSPHARTASRPGRPATRRPTRRTAASTPLRLFDRRGARSPPLTVSALPPIDVEPAGRRRKAEAVPAARRVAGREGREVGPGGGGGVEDEEVVEFD